jgi:hypothetical protein
MDIIYGELYKENLHLINDTSVDTCVGFELPIFQVTAIADGQHFVQLFGITKEEPTLKFLLYLNFKFRDFEMGGNNASKKILDILYIRRANKEPKFDSQHENFLRFLNDKFNLGSLTSYSMKEDIEFKYICLSNNLVTFEDFFKNKLALKLFHEAPYYELYLNIDFPNKKVEFREKDEEYRKSIFNSFLSTNSN